MFGLDDAALATLGSGAMNFAGGLLSGGQNQQARDGTMVIPAQRALLQDMLAKYYLGQGDYGQASAMREGRDTLYNEAAAAGVPIQSGNVQSALASKFGQAAQQSGLQRMLYGLQLAQASPAFANTGENYGYPERMDIRRQGRMDLGMELASPSTAPSAGTSQGPSRRLGRRTGNSGFGF